MRFRDKIAYFFIGLRNSENGIVMLVFTLVLFFGERRLNLNKIEVL